MPKAFISYARDGSHGENLAIEIQQQLQAAGFAVFRDVTGLKPGDPWFHKLEFELETSDVMVLVLSEKVRKSKWVHNEFSMAEEIGIPVIPVLAETIRQPLWVRHLQILDFCGARDWQILLEVLRAKTGGEIPSVSSFSKESTLQTEHDVTKSAFLSVPPLLEENIPRVDGVTTKSVIPVIPPLLKKSTLQIGRDVIGVTSPFNKGGTRGISLPWASDSGVDQYGRYADLKVKSVTQRFRWIEPGTFRMGSQESESERFDNEVCHQVTLTQGFWLADTACTQFLWIAVMGENSARFSDNFENPAEQRVWYDVEVFLTKLNELIHGGRVRLPTEAEWEYACRAGTNTAFSFGDNINPEQVNYNGNYPYANGKKGLYRKKTVPVKSLPANPWGLYEMHGNLWEWCQDVWQEELPAEPVIDPKGAGDDTGIHVVRGGAWDLSGGDVRSSIRYGNLPGYRLNGGIGFRLALGN